MTTSHHDTQEPSNDNEIVVIQAFILAADTNRYLTIRKTAHSSSKLKEHWELVGGKMEPGEDFADTLIRESSEETKVLKLNRDEVEDLKFFNIQRDIPYKDGKTLTFKAIWINVTTEFIPTTSNEHDQYDWMKLSENKRKITDAARETIQAARDMQNSQMQQAL